MIICQFGDHVRYNLAIISGPGIICGPEVNLPACLRAKKSFTMADKGKLLIQQAEKVKSLLCGWIPKREATVHTLRVLADKLLYSPSITSHANCKW